MNGNSIVLDTNIILYLLNGNVQLSDILVGMDLNISIISEIELLGYGGLSSEEKSKIKLFLSYCQVIALNDIVKDNSILIKQQAKIKTPDAIVAATAQYLNIPLITADRGFDKISHLDLILFKI